LHLFVLCDTDESQFDYFVLFSCNSYLRDRGGQIERIFQAPQESKKRLADEERQAKKDITGRIK
jgi:hypothetical protein